MGLLFSRHDIFMLSDIWFGPSANTESAFLWSFLLILKYWPFYTERVTREVYQSRVALLLCNYCMQYFRNLVVQCSPSDYSYQCSAQTSGMWILDLRALQRRVANPVVGDGGSVVATRSVWQEDSFQFGTNSWASFVLWSTVLDGSDWSHGSFLRTVTRNALLACPAQTLVSPLSPRNISNKTHWNWLYEPPKNPGWLEYIKIILPSYMEIIIN